MMLRAYLKVRLHGRSVLGVLIALLIFTGIGILNPDILAQFGWETNPKFYLANYASFFFWYVTLFFCIPLFLIFLQPQIYFFQKEEVLYRFQSKRKSLLIHLGICAIEAILFVAFLYVLLFFRAALYGQIGHYSENSSFFWMAFLSECCTYVFLAFVCVLFARVFSMPILGCLIPYLLLLCDYFLHQKILGTDSSPVFLGFLDAISVVPDQMDAYFTNLLRVILCVVAVVVICLLVYPHRDSLPKETGEQK